MNDLMTSNDKMEEDEINLLDYWRVLVKRKRIIGLIVIAAIIVSVIYALMLPPIYASTASILPPQQEGGGGAAGIISQLSGGLGGLAGSFLGGQTPAGQWMAILKSQTIKDTIIQRFDLMKSFEAKTMDEAKKTLDGMVKISKSKEEVLSITVENKDPKRAAAMANAFVEELDRVNKGMVTT